MSPGTEFARDFCAGIGPLQLGVVLVLLPFKLPSSQIPYKCVFLLLFSLIKCIAFVRPLFDHIL